MLDPVVEMAMVETPLVEAVVLVRVEIPHQVVPEVTDYRFRHLMPH
jgi:hypothetical protein